MNEKMPDPLIVALPDLLKAMPEGERTIELIAFKSVPGSAEITTEFIVNGEVVEDENDEPTEDEASETAEVVEALDEPIPGDDTITQIIELDEAAAHEIEAVREKRYRGRRRAKWQMPRFTLSLSVLLMVAGAAMLVYGLLVQTSELAVKSPVLALISLPALIGSGACFALALIERRS